MKNIQNLFLLLLTALAGSVHADGLGTAFTYQGRLTLGTNAATGLYDFRFTLYDDVSAGTVVAGPLTPNGLGVSNGLFTATLDFGASAFNGAARWLAIEVRTNGAASFAALAPRQPLTPTPYALLAENAASATVASTANAVANSAVTAAGIQNNQVVKSLNGLRDQVMLNGGTNVLLRTNGNALSVSAEPWQPVNVTNTWFPGGRVGIGKAPSVGALDVFDGTGPNLSGGSIHVGGTLANSDPKLIHFGDMQGSGLGYVYLGENGQDDRLEFRAGAFYFNNGSVGIGKTNPATALDVNGAITANNFQGNGAGLTYLSPTNLNLQGNARLNDHDLYLRSGTDTNHGVGWYGAGKPFAAMSPDGPVLYGRSGGMLGSTSGGQKPALSWSQDARVAIDPGNLNTGAVTFASLSFGGGNTGEGIASKRDAGGNQNGLDFYTGYQAALSIDNQGRVGIGTTSPSDATLDVRGDIRLSDTQLLLRGGTDRHHGLGWRNTVMGMLLEGPFLYGWDGGALGISAPDSVVLKWDWHGNVWVSNDLSVVSLSIRGGADLVEPFPVTEGNAEPGTVMVIDETHPGHLTCSTKAYDSRVAGVISGAGGVRPGLQLSQSGVLDQGQKVALTGRVYVRADTHNGPIAPGDLLTTSDVPGYAMKVTDHARAQGAILGKAMTRLDAGRGLVLVLVTLQ